MAGEYEKLLLLGSGSFGKAWLVNCFKKNKKLVLKEISIEALSDKEMEQALMEVKVLARCRHVNIISYCEAFVRSGCLQIVMEYADNGDLQKMILEKKGNHFENEMIMDWFIQICFALQYLHSENILHRDLKPQNLFLTSDNIVKVGDFGIARFLQDTADHAVTAIGTPYYLSPEICQQRPYNFKSDMWSLGCVLYELCCLKVPFEAPNLPLLVLKILAGCYDPLPSHCGAVMEDLIAVLLKSDPSQRPSAKQILKVPALQTQVKLTYRKCIYHREQRQRKRAMSREAVTPDVSNEEKGPEMCFMSLSFMLQGVLPPFTYSLIYSFDEHLKSACHQTYNVKSPLLRRFSVATPKLKDAIKRQRIARSAEVESIPGRKHKDTRPPVLNLQEVMLATPSLPVAHPSDSEYPEGGCSRFNNIDEGIMDDFHDSVFETDDNVLEQNCLAGCRDDDAYSKQRIIKGLQQDKAADRASRVDDLYTPGYATNETDTKIEHSDNSLYSINQRLDCTPPHSDTYVMARKPVSPKKEIFCPVCENKMSSQYCLNEALFTATALICRGKPRAERCLSHFLITHLGSELSLHLCSQVHSAFSAREEYSSVERRLDDNCKSYLPAVFQLLSLNGNHGDT